MPEGIEKIVIVNDAGLESAPRNFIIEGVKPVALKVIYYPGTEDALKGYAKWIVKPKDGGPYTKEDHGGEIGDSRGLSVVPKYCGPKEHSVEAFLEEPTNSYPRQLTFTAFAPQKIVSTKWSREDGGDDIRQSPIKYGEDVWLNVETEGLNGAALEVDIYSLQTGSDEKVATINIECVNGEINHPIENTFSWRAGTGWITSNEEKFYVKIRLRGSQETIKDDKDQDIHARYLRINDEIVTRSVAVSQSARPATVGESEINIERYELCRFLTVSVLDEGENIVVLDEGRLQRAQRELGGGFDVSEVIYFPFEEATITADSEKVLDGIANILFDNPYVHAKLGAHCDIRGSHEFNDILSNERASAAVEYLVGKGVPKTLLFGNGYGKRRLLIEGEHISEEEHQLNRRVTIEFKLNGDDAESIIFETIAPDISKKKKLVVTVDPYNTDKCLRRGTSLEHETKIKVIELTPEGQSDPFEQSGTVKEHDVYSNLSRLEIAPLQYIWPHSSTTNNFNYFFNSCRYYSNKEKPTMIVKAYPDIKWDFHFFLNLSNSPSVTWQGLQADKLRKMRQQAGYMGATATHRQVAIDFGVILEANWNKSGSVYDSKFDATLKYDSKIKKFYDVFASLREISRGITSKTKGKVTSNRLGSILPFSVEIMPPNFSLGAEWQLTRAQKDDNPIAAIGTEVKFYLDAKPIVGLKMVIDLLDLLVQGVVAATTGGTANVGAKKIFDEVRAWLADDDHAVNLKMYIDLELFGTIQGGADIKYHTVTDENEGNLKLDATIGIELKAGIEVRAGVVLVGVEFYAEGQLKASGKGSITFGHKLVYNSRDGGSLNYKPELVFDGIVVDVVIKAEVGMSIKRGLFSGLGASRELADYRYNDKVVDEFDVMAALGQLTGIDPEIPLIKN